MSEGSVDLRYYLLRAMMPDPTHGRPAMPFMPSLSFPNQAHGFRSRAHPWTGKITDGEGLVTLPPHPADCSSAALQSTTNRSQGKAKSSPIELSKLGKILFEDCETSVMLLFILLLYKDLRFFFKPGKKNSKTTSVSGRDPPFQNPRTPCLAEQGVGCL